MVYVIVYDISDDRCRYRISKFLEGKGQRIQESAFECRLQEDELNSVIDTLQGLLGSFGNIRIYPVCANCMAKSIGIGEITEVTGQDGYAIF